MYTHVQALAPIFCPIKKDDLLPEKSTDGQPTAGDDGELRDVVAPLLPTVEAEIRPEPASVGEFPEKRTNLCSRLFFCWLFPLLWRGYKHPLVSKDIWTLAEGDKTETVLKRFDRVWQKELLKPKPSLGKTVYTTFMCDIVIGGLVHVLAIVSNITVPMFITAFSLFFDSLDSEHPWPMWYGYVLGGAFFLAQVLLSMLARL